MRVVKILCPYHPDTQPSCCVYLNQGTFYCFGCSKSGSVITLCHDLGIPPSVFYELVRNGKRSLKSFSVHWQHNYDNSLLEFWRGCEAKEIGPGYAIHRGYAPEELSVAGVDYSQTHNLILFPSEVWVGEKRIGAPGQFREPWEKGKYLSNGTCGWFGRTSYIVGDPRIVHLFEGPFDALSALSHFLDLTQDFVCSSTGGMRCPDFLSRGDPRVKRVILYPDGDEGGIKWVKYLVHKAHHTYKIEIFRVPWSTDPEDYFLRKHLP